MTFAWRAIPVGQLVGSAAGRLAIRMSPTFSAPVGTFDVLPPNSARYERLAALFAQTVGRAGYGLHVPPMFEEVGVFLRVGEHTDVVTKEMYDFRDKGERHIALRPEGTASVVRAWVEHRPTLPFKAYYIAPSFRYERPQAGRYRQHHQMGVEALGSLDPDLDVEVIALAVELYRALGISKYTLRLNSMGDKDSRPAYLRLLQDYLRSRLDDIDPEDRARVEANPLRVLDSKRAATQVVTADAPRLADHLGPEAAAHFNRVKAGLGTLGITYTVDPSLVRGFDYYTHTVFEFASYALEGAQNAIGGGGRYQDLTEDMGGPPTTGIGFGLGMERILLACDAEDVFPVPHDRVEVVVVDTTGTDAALRLTTELRAAGVRCDRSYDGRSFKAGVKVAHRLGARFAIIVGQRELAAGTVTVKDMGSGEQEPVARETVVPHLVAKVRCVSAFTGGTGTGTGTDTNTGTGTGTGG